MVAEMLRRQGGLKGRIADAFVPLRAFPAYRRFLTARLVSQSGSSMAPIALAFAVLQIGGGAGALGSVLAVSLVPQMGSSCWSEAPSRTGTRVAGS